MTRYIKHTVILAGLALALPTMAEDELRRSGGMEPMDSEQMDAARVPLTSESEQPDTESSDEEWLEDQHLRVLQQQESHAGDEPSRSRQDESFGLTPFQTNFRDAIINQMRGAAGDSR